MTRERLERLQVWFYLVAIVAGAAVGFRYRPSIADALIYAPLGLLLYATFAQVPVLHLPNALRNRRYLSATLLANFVLVPVLVWLVSWIVPRDPAILLGIYMVLLVPCTDWFMVFTHLGQGDAKLAIASTPVILLAQFALLPLYLWLFMGQTFTEVIHAGPFLTVFLLLIVIPLILAGATQHWAERSAPRSPVIGMLAWIPIPCLTLVLFLIAASQAGHVADDWRGMERVAVAFVLYLAVAPLIGMSAARLLGLPTEAGRTLIFSVGTRNSFVVLPFVLALPAGWEMAVTVIVLQPLFELAGMLVYLRVVPRWRIVPPALRPEV